MLSLKLTLGVCDGCLWDKKNRSLFSAVEPPAKRLVLVIRGVKLCEECLLWRLRWAPHPSLCAQNQTVPDGDGYTKYECDCYLQEPYDPEETRARIYKPGDPRKKLYDAT